jgi:3-phenylpropionate/trans-cinnamate dioxygenase ferredoxin reductase subunit
MSQTCVVIGASHAASAFVTGLRQDGWEGDIKVIGEEPYIPYHRPPLSKDLLAGKKDLNDIYIRPEQVYEKANVEFILGVRATEINAGNKEIVLANGSIVSYDKLALTVGSRARTMSMTGDNLQGIYYLRNFHDVEQIKKYIKSDGKAVIIGGGYIGLEAAAVLNKLGMKVTVLEMMSRVMERVTSPEISEFYTRVHSEEGVDIRCEVAASGFEGEGSVSHVLCDDGTSIEADLVIIGIGIVPNIELAQVAGLKIENGIVVDEHACTSDPDIVAAGDCTYHYNHVYERWIRLESVQNASDQARVAAATVAGKERTYDSLPWFWSDQYDVKLQIAGLSQGYDQIIIRGDYKGSRSFAVFYLKDGLLIAVDAVNKAPEFMMGKRLITTKAQLDINKLADETISIKEVTQ